MSIEIKQQELITALTAYIKEVTQRATVQLQDTAATTNAGIITSRNTGTTVDAPTKAEEKAIAKEAKKAEAENKKAAKLKAGAVLKDLGKSKLTELLSCFGAKKFSELKAGVGVFEDFINRADVLLAANADDDLLDDGPAEEAIERTLDDVKGLLLKVKNEDGLAIPPGWREFLQRVRDDQLAALKRLWVVWSGVAARYIRVRRQLAARNKL